MKRLAIIAAALGMALMPLAAAAQSSSGLDAEIDALTRRVANLEDARAGTGAQAESLQVGRQADGSQPIAAPPRE